MNRFRAFSIHFAISIVIVSTMLLLMFLIWYPKPYFEANGAAHIVTILATVDVVLGPLLTFIVFKSGKPGLRFDLTLIALLQIGALGYGTHVIYSERPSYVVYAVDVFKLVSASMIDAELISDPDMKPGPFTRPKLIFARLPDDPQERSNLLMKTLSTGRDLESLPEYYEPYHENIATVVEHSRPLNSLLKSSDNTQLIVRNFIDTHNLDPDDLVYVPLIGKNKNLSLVLDARTGLPCGALAIDPEFLRS